MARAVALPTATASMRIFFIRGSGANRANKGTTTIRRAPGLPAISAAVMSSSRSPVVRDLDAPVHFIYYATGVTPAMAMKLVGLGSQYAVAAKDSAGKPLDGGKTYKIHLPPNIAAKDFWSLMVYDIQSRSMLQTEAEFPASGPNAGHRYQSRHLSRCLVRPTAPKGHEPNFVQTVPGKGWNVLFRLYGPGQSWFDETWKAASSSW